MHLISNPDTPPELRSWLQQKLRELYPILIKDPFYTVRTLAVSALAEIRDDNTIPLLCSSLKYESYIVRAQAARSLGEIGDPRDDRGISWLVQGIQRSKSHKCAQALGKAFLSAQLTNEQKAQIRRQGNLPVLRSWEGSEWERDEFTGNWGWIPTWKTELTTLERHLTDANLLRDD